MSGNGHEEDQSEHGNTAAYGRFHGTVAGEGTALATRLMSTKGNGS